jgi:predicted porin
MYKGAFVQDSTVMSLGYKHVTGPHTIYTAFNRYNDKTRFDSDTDSYGVVYSYAFSKRTDMNFVLTHFNNKGSVAASQGQAAPGQAGFLGGFTKAPGEDSNNFAIGLRHRF